MQVKDFFFIHRRDIHCHHYHRNSGLHAECHGVEMINHSPTPRPVFFLVTFNCPLANRMVRIVQDHPFDIVGFPINVIDKVGNGSCWP